MRAALASSCPAGNQRREEGAEHVVAADQFEQLDLGVGEFVIDLVGDLELAAVYSAERVAVVEVRLHAPEIALQQAVARRVARPGSSTAYWIASSVTPGTPEIGANSPRSGPPSATGSLVALGSAVSVVASVSTGTVSALRLHSTPARRTRSSRWLSLDSADESSLLFEHAASRDRPRRSAP